MKQLKNVFGLIIFGLFLIFTIYKIISTDLQLPILQIFLFVISTVILILGVRNRPEKSKKSDK